MKSLRVWGPMGVPLPSVKCVTVPVDSNYRLKQELLLRQAGRGKTTMIYVVLSIFPKARKYPFE